MQSNINLHYIDIAIVAGYLVVCLVVGLMKFDKVKTLRDYTLGIKPFSNTLLFATIFATAIGLNRTVGVVEKSYSLGLVYIIPLLANPILWFGLSKLLSPNVALFKQQKFMSLGDMMEYWYGKTGKWTTNITSIFFTIAVSAGSIIAIGYLCSHFLGISTVYGELIAVIIITSYSALGGVQAVAYTDLFQMLIFFVALPVICAIGLDKAGGIEHVFSSLPATHLTIDRSNIVLFSSFVLYSLVPVSTIPYVQRALIAKDKDQLSLTFNSTGIGVFFFLLCMTLIGLIVYTLNPTINPNTALYYFMSNYLYAGILGVVIAGLLAVIMSTQDSYLNTTSALIARDICKEIWPNLTDKNQLTIARISCVVITVSATLVSFANDSVLGTFWLAENFYDPLITVPLIAGLLGIRMIKKDFIPFAVACIVAVLCARIVTGTFDTRSFSAGVVTSIVALYIANRRFKALHPEASPSRIPEILRYLREAATTHIFNPGAVYIFSLTTLVSLIASVFIFTSRHDLLTLHAVGIALCVLLLFKELLGNHIRRLWLQKVWYATLLICLPLSCSYPLFIGKLNVPLITSFILSLVLLYILVSPAMFLLLAALGTLLSYLTAAMAHPYFAATIDTYALGLWSSFTLTTCVLMQVYNKNYVSKAIHSEVTRLLETRIDERTEALRKSLAAKKEFLDKIGHEIRTPLHGIIGASEDLLDRWEKLKESEKREMANFAAKSGKRLMNLMSNVLDLAEFNSGKIKAVFVRDVDITALIDKAINDGKLVAEEEHKDLTFRTEIDSHLKRKIECDVDRIAQVLTNLINNAISYSNHGEILIKADDYNGKLKISVTDNGVGIPENELTLVFDAFTQSSRTKDPSKGKGLGLAICREIIGLHHGYIDAENNKERPGSTISFIIPYAQTTDEAINADQATHPGELSGKVLLVDDEKLCLDIGGMLLSTFGLRVVKASGGKDALAYLKANPKEIDVILLDMMMPDMYGLNVLEAIKADAELSHIPVIIQSGLTDKDEAAKARKAGAASHITKPWNKDVMRNILVKLLLKEKQLVDA